MFKLKIQKSKTLGKGKRFQSVVYCVFMMFLSDGPTMGKKETEKICTYSRNNFYSENNVGFLKPAQAFKAFSSFQVIFQACIRLVLGLFQPRFKLVSSPF